MKKIIAENDLIVLKIEDYTNLVQKLVLKLSHFKQIKSIYQMGGLSQPGISDIDLIIVTKSDSLYNNSVNVSRNAICDNDIEKYMLMHAPFVIPDKVFHQIDTIFYCSDLKLLYGEEQYVQNYDEAFSEISSIYKMISVIIHTYPRFEVYGRDISLRSFLTFGYSLKHSYRLLQLYEKDFIDHLIEHFIEEITLLRKSIKEIQGNPFVDISELIELGKEACIKMLRQLEIIVKDRFDFTTTEFQKAFYIKNVNNVFEFTKDKKQYYAMTSNKYFVTITLPIIFAPFLLFPLDDTTKLTKFHKRHIIGRINIGIDHDLYEYLLMIKKNYDIYRRLLFRSNVLNGMPFELNTSMFWVNRNKKNLQYDLKAFVYKMYKYYKIRKRLAAKLDVKLT